MAFSKELQKAFNEQMTREFYSSYLYLAMAAHCDAEGLKGFANWLKIQAGEENMHAMKFFAFIISRGGRAELGAIDAPPKSWKSPLNVFEETFKHEQLVTKFINELYDMALSEKDHAATSFLQFFIDEQVEEEDTANEIVGKLKFAGDHAASLFLIDNELGARVPAPEPAA